MTDNECFCCGKEIIGFGFEVDGKIWCARCMKERKRLGNLIDEVEEGKHGES